MNKSIIIAKRAKLTPTFSIILYTTLFLFTIFLTFEFSLIFTIGEKYNIVYLVLTIITGLLIDILLTIFLIVNIKKIKFNNSLIKNIITYNNNIFTINTPYETLKINKKEIIRVVYKLHSINNYGTLFICYLEEKEMLITLENIVNPKDVQKQIEEITGLNLID